jgi:hypothetical protein
MEDFDMRRLSIATLLCLLTAAPGLHGQELPFFLEQAKSESAEERVMAFHELATFEGPEVESALAAGIADPAPEVRQSAATAAIGHTSEVVTLALIKAFQDQQAEVQQVAISVFIMNNRTIPEGYRPLLSLLESPDPRTRAYAAWAVGLYRKPGSIGRLEKLFRNGDELQRANVCFALGEIGSPDGLETIHRGLLDVAATVREKAAQAAGRIADQRSLALLEKLAGRETEPSVKRAVDRALEKFGGETQPAE